LPFLRKDKWPGGSFNNSYTAALARHLEISACHHSAGWNQRSGNRHFLFFRLLFRTAQIDYFVILSERIIADVEGRTVDSSGAEETRTGSRETFAPQRSPFLPAFIDSTP
jgi:hypothetical protein